MRAWVVAIIALVSAIKPAAVSAEEIAAQLAPASAWTIDYGDWYCALNRTFRDNDQVVQFSFTREPLASKNWLRFGFLEQPGERDDDDRTVISIDGQIVTQEAHYNVYSTEAYRIREVWVDLAKVPLSQTRESLHFSLPRQGTIAAATPGFQEAWKALDICMADLYSKLGIDRKAVDAIATPAKGSFFRGVKTPDAPAKFALLFWVNEAGRVDECKLLKPSGQAKADATLCPQIMKRAQYKPALDKDGNAIRAPIFENVSLLIQAYPGP